MKYRGRFSNDSKNGNFSLSYCSNGSLYYAGGHEDGKFSGKGICYWDSSEGDEVGRGFRAFGSFKGGLLHGDECAIFDKVGRLRYFGRLEEGRKKEVGVSFDENGDAVIKIIE